ncbi:FAD binding domain-containing protein [Chenggangzhangella methanolivorans]|uniref:FAD binding domain-containing protein n=1 Tax=Chenggangzhangella methanolivorans TaxID=1437009 RepID=UPI0021BDDE02|nr:FAD binding domain-containing protein [Chenggangzhangella methanolivorans]
MMARVAAGIAYRAVRNRGTIGGSLAHADPAADWVSTLSALGAEIEIASRAGRRRLAIGAFLTGALSTALQPGELLVSVRIPLVSGAARFGYVKHARKIGEFAHAIGAALVDPERGIARGGGRDRRAAARLRGRRRPLRPLDRPRPRRDGTAARRRRVEDMVDRHIHVEALAALAQGRRAGSHAEERGMNAPVRLHRAARRRSRSPSTAARSRPRSSRAPISPTSCARTLTSPARISAASTGSAAPARSPSTASRRAPA